MHPIPWSSISDYLVCMEGLLGPKSYLWVVHWATISKEMHSSAQWGSGEKGEYQGTRDSSLRHATGYWCWSWKFAIDHHFLSTFTQEGLDPMVTVTIVAMMRQLCWAACGKVHVKGTGKIQNSYPFVVLVCGVKPDHGKPERVGIHGCNLNRSNIGKGRGYEDCPSENMCGSITHGPSTWMQCTWSWLVCRLWYSEASLFVTLL